jgi:hypothetical protein
MSYVRWSTMWHVTLAAEPGWTLCGRPVPKKAQRREIAPLEMFLCKICRGRA